jgi:hypothetical protein
MPPSKDDDTKAVTAGIGDTDEPIEPTPLFEHAKRPEWGLAIMAWERNKRRAYQFQDGKLRLIKEGYYHLMQEVDRPADSALEITKSLKDKLGVSEARREVVKKARAKGKKILTLKDQITIFNIMYPNGFQGEEWDANIRGEGEGRRLKRHREPALQDAKVRLSKEALEPLIEGEQYTEVINTALDVLKKTSLVRPVHLKPLKELAKTKHPDLAKAIFDLFWGSGKYSMRFDAFVRVLSSNGRVDCPWPLATVLPALVHPKEHVCVRPSSFRRQARWMAPRLEYSSHPEGKQYIRFRKMARAVGRRLKEAELKPRDLVDVYDFIRLTLRPSAKKLLKE